MPPETSFDIRALTKRTGFDARTVRRYAQRGLIPRPDFAGKDTRYGREHLVRLLAIRKLSERTLRLDALRAELSQRTFEELESLAGFTPSTSAPTPTNASPGATISKPGAAPKSLAGERWLRIALLPGLELMMRDGAPELVTRIATEIRERYAASS